MKIIKTEVKLKINKEIKKYQKYQKYQKYKKLLNFKIM